MQVRRHGGKGGRSAVYAGEVAVTKAAERFRGSALRVVCPYGTGVKHGGIHTGEEAYTPALFVAHTSSASATTSAAR